MSEQNISIKDMYEYRTIYEGGEGEITEKKSRFIAAVRPAETEEEAIAFIDSVRKAYWDARHHCYAYIIGQRSDLKRMSDDGEPGGTAGKPMLDILQGEGLTNLVAVVTRYFGGTLLGTGGLARAYSSAVRAGLDSSIIITKIPGFKLQATIDYTDLGKIQHLLLSQGIKILDSVYTDKVMLEILTPEKETDDVMAALTEATSGKAELRKASVCYFADIDGNLKIF